MPEITKPLVIKVQSRSVPNGIKYKWGNLTDQMTTFTKDIITPEIGVDKDGNSTVNIGAIVSGMPTIFARANLFKLSLDYITDQNEESSGLMKFYKSLVDEWRGFISCIALDYANVSIERVYLKYSDGKSISKTVNIYEPKGAFGNLLFERKPLWCDQGLLKNEDKIPFIDVISYKGHVAVGGTSPDSFLFTSVSYKIVEKAPFVSIQNGKFTDPLNSELTPDQLLQLHGYVSHIIQNINKFKDSYSNLSTKIQPQTANLDGNLTTWKAEIETYAAKKGIKLNNSSAPPIDLFLKPFSILFNFSTELYGSEGLIAETPTGLENPIKFDPRKLLLSKDAEIANINFGNEAAKNPQFLHDQPIYVIQAETKGMPGIYHYFALPLSPLGLNIFGKTIGALVGMDQQSAIQSRIHAEYDPSADINNLKVKLSLFTNSGKEKPLEEVYTIGKTQIKGHDILIWPNFISKQWNRYFMYSEIPHNTTSQSCAFKATPFVGDVNDLFRILLDENGMPLLLAKDGIINLPDKYKDSIKAKLHVISDNKVADNKYKYEIYESSQPFKGVCLTYAGKDSGYAIIRYSIQNDKLPKNQLGDTKQLADAQLGIDFGSTNSSVAYFSQTNEQMGKKLFDQVLKFRNRRVSLFASDEKNNDLRPALEDEIFFFQNDEINSNAIKSILTIHDQKRLFQDTSVHSNEMLVSQAIKGGFPCFEKNLPIESATENRYRLMYPRVGTAEIVHNMKWSRQEIENNYKKAYLGTLLLHVYAQLFEENHIPISLKWSFPSSMGTNLVGKYIQIWDTLGEVNPIEGGKVLKIFKPSSSVNYDTSGAKVFGGTAGGAWGNTNQQEPKPTWGSSDSPWNSQTQNTPQPLNTGGWGNQSSSKPGLREISTETGPIKFNFKQLGADECLTEACAVANYMAKNPNFEKDINYLTISFDVGGSTTDISALCQMMGPNGPGLAMVKQNSIRFAAQRVSHATKVSPNFRSVLLEICERKKITVQGLNVEPFKYTAETSSYYFEQIVDRLEENDFPVFYELVRGKCPELMSVNIYVTGLIMFYAGQLAYKLIKEVIKSEDKHPAMSDWKPIVNIVFAGKGARIFDWFKAIDKQASNKYYTDLFISGFGGMQKATEKLFPGGYMGGPPVRINPTNEFGSSNIKYEVSKGLALPTESLLVPQNNEAIEILGEEGFIVLNSLGQPIKLEYDNSITPEMMETVGTYFMNSPIPGQNPCPKFMDFAGVFFQVATSLFGLKMTQKDFMNGFQGMNINSYIKTLPEYYAAVESKEKGESKQFDFVAPIIILEGMKFYDDYLLKGII